MTMTDFPMLHLAPRQLQVVDPLSGEEASRLDPGIREIVLRLREWGFQTTESGDGVSKPSTRYASGEALPFPHVWCATTKADLLPEANRLQTCLGRSWLVEASYAPTDGSCRLFARKTI